MDGGRLRRTEQGTEWIQRCVAMDGSAVVHMKDVPRTSPPWRRQVRRAARVRPHPAGPPRHRPGDRRRHRALRSRERDRDVGRLHGGPPGRRPSTYTPAYTGDCTGERGAFAATLIAGRVP